MLTQKQIERWENLIKRLDNFGCDGSQSVITVNILTDETGRPLLWSEPERSRFEPRSRAAQIFELVAGRIPK